MLGACGGGSSGSTGSGGGNGGTVMYSLGGTVAGLNSGNQVTFQVVINTGSNSTDSTNSATVYTDGTFTTPPMVPANGNYVVLVASQPAGQTCTVSNAAGSNVTANVSNIKVVCSATIFSVSGTVTGLIAGQQVTLLNNYADPVVVNSNTGFQFVTPVAMGAGYSVTVKTGPVMSDCTVNNGSGVNVSANVTNVNVSCAITESVLYSFQAYPDANFPQVKLLQGSDGNFYGTTGLGGDYPGNSLGRGAVFKVTPLGVESVVHSFMGIGTQNDGACPQAGVIQGKDGNLYGTTCLGGSNNLGTVYSLTTGGTENWLYSFGASGQGKNPYAELTQASDGNFYGTTSGGGAYGYGSVYKISSTGATTLLYSFGASDGHYPHSTLVQGTDGNFYGTTYAGGTSNNGTVFMVTSTGIEKILWSFAGAPADGSMTVPLTSTSQSNPSASLIQALDGNFYGTTPSGGTNGNGTVFRITSSGVLTVLYSFKSGTLDGQTPQAGLLQASDGYFYGTTVNGGAQGLGTVYRIDTAGHEMLMYSFGGAVGDGGNPYAALIQASDGHLYTTTYQGGANYKGAVVKF